MYNSCVLPAITLWCRDQGLLPNKHRTNLRPHIQKWKEVAYAQHHTRGQKDQHLDLRHLDLGRANVIDIIRNVRKRSGPGQDTPWQPPQRWPTDLACHHLATIRQEKTMDNSQAPERQHGQTLEGPDLEEDSSRQANLETAC